MQSICRNRFSFSAYRCAQLLSVRTFSATPVSFACIASQQTNAQNLVQRHKLQPCQWRNYVHLTSADMTQAKITEKVMTVIKLFEKINAAKLTMESHFMKDLGLDSLDHVELIMAVEDEFGLEIPDQDSDKLVKPSEVVKYLCQKLKITQ